ncbi:sensor histidine kinase [Candidatus Omnitrophota bacterium]
MSKSKNTSTNYLSVLRRRAEEALQSIDNVAIDTSPENIKHIIQELHTYQVELEMQNEELRRSQEELEESRSKYSDLYDFAPVGYLTVDRNGLIQEINLTGADMLGMERHKIIKKPLAQFIMREDEDTYYFNKNNILKTKESQTCEIKLKKDDSFFYARLECKPLLDSEGNVSHIRTIIIDITEKNLKDEQIKSALADKEVLLREVNHRVKNNLQVIISLLRLQGRSIHDKTYHGYLDDCIYRINSIALVHEMLIHSGNFAQLDFRDYIVKLCRNINSVYGGKSIKTELTFMIDTFDVSVDRAIHLGLIINELVTNSLKYAFSGIKNNRITISLKKNNSNKHELIVSDNGVGLPENMNWRESDSLGLKMVLLLGEGQIHGNVDVSSSDKGTEVSVIF